MNENKLRKRARARGVTLVEVLIVVAIMALISGGVGFMVMSHFQKAKIDAASSETRSIRQAVIAYRAFKNVDACPSLDDLIAARSVDAEDADDPWDSPYEVSCDDLEVIVRSAGPDRQLGSDDDIAAGLVPAR